MVVNPLIFLHNGNCSRESMMRVKSGGILYGLGDHDILPGSFSVSEESNRIINPNPFFLIPAPEPGRPTIVLI